MTAGLSHNQRMKRIAIGLLLLCGCAGMQSDDPASPHYAYPQGWALQLKRPLTIPAGEATVRLQYGRIVPRNGVQEHDPFCVVEINTVRDVPQVLAPGRFEVRRVTRNVSPITAVAPARLMRVRYVDDDGEPSFLYFITEFALRDPAQPELRSLRCAWDQLAPGNRALMRHLKLGEIRAALGDWITPIPPGEAL